MSGNGSFDRAVRPGSHRIDLELSQFENRNLWRQYRSPISAFLYVDPFEVRQEVVLRPRDLQQWMDLGLAGRDTLRADEWPAVKDRVAAFLAGACPQPCGRALETADSPPGDGLNPKMIEIFDFDFFFGSDNLCPSLVAVFF